MRSVPFGILCSAAALVSAAPAFAASDYLLVIDGVDGEASSVIEVESWSWGESRPSTNTSGAAGRESSSRPNLGSSGQDGVSRESPTRPTVQASQNTQSLRESPTGRPTGRSPDLEGLATVDEVSGFSLKVIPGNAARSKCAAGQHIKHAHLVARGVVYDFEDVIVTSCDSANNMALAGKVREFRGHVTLMK